MRQALTLLATVASGCFYGLSFPTTSWRPLAWVALVPFLVALRRASTRGTVVLVWCWTVVAAYTLGDWFAPAIARYYHQPVAVGVALFFGVTTFLAAPWFLAFGLAYRTLATRWEGATLVLLTAAAWVAAEFARARWAAANPWALVGYSQAGVDRVMQIADVAGIYGVSFVVVVVNAALAERLASVGHASTRRALATAAAVVCGVVSYGQYRLTDVVPDVDDAPSLGVAMVQGNLDVGSQWRPEFYGTSLDTYLRLTHERLSSTGADVVFWPENALTFFLQDEPHYRDAIGRILRRHGAQLIAGGPRADETEPGRHYNSIFLVSEAGRIEATYDKQHLVPLAERFPFPWLGMLNQRHTQLREFSPGGPATLLPTRIGPAGVMICSEAMFPEIAGARVAAGATFFVDPANDTWLTPKFSAQQFDIARTRAIEQRRYLVRASTSGPSAVVDPLGRPVVRTEFFTQTAISGSIRPRTDLTVYGRVGDAFAMACTLAVLGGVLFTRRRFG